jgi:hypothetical protein
MNVRLWRTVPAVGVMIGASLWGCSGDVVLEHPGAASDDGSSPATIGSSSSGGNGGAGGGAACTSDWAHVLGGEGSQLGRSVAVDAQGAVVASIQTEGVVTLDGAPFATAQSGFVIARLEASGAVGWIRPFPGVAVNDQLLPVAIDAAGEVFVAGTFSHDLDLGGGLTTTAPGSAIFVAKLGANGGPLWVRSFPGTFAGNGLAGLVADAAGNVFFAGSLSGETLDVGGQTLSGDLFVVKLDVAGDAVWARAYPGVMMENGALAVSGEGNVIVAGSLYDSVDFGNGTLTTAGDYDVVVVELEGAGNPVWSRRFGDEGLQRASALAVGADGGVFLAGTFSTGIDFGVGGAVDAGGQWGSFVAGLGSSGNPLWSKRVSADVASVGVMAALPSGGLMLAGNLGAGFDVGCGPLSSDSASSAYLAALGPFGVCATQRSLATTQAISVTGLGSGPSGHAAAIGLFQGALDLGKGKVSADINDGFLLDLAPPCVP